jgi:hypothetical protein
MLQDREQHVHHHHHHHHYHHHRTHQTAVGPTLMEPETIETSHLALAYPMGELIGREVHNDVGDHIGRLDDLLVDGGDVPYAVLSVGMFVGTEGHKVVVAYSDLFPSEERLVLPGADRDRLMRMMAYERRMAAAKPPLHGNNGHDDTVAETAFHEPVPGLVAHITDGAA